jgi:hypothetical protein
MGVNSQDAKACHQCGKGRRGVVQQTVVTVRQSRPLHLFRGRVMQPVQVLQGVQTCNATYAPMSPTAYTYNAPPTDAVYVGATNVSNSVYTNYSAGSGYTTEIGSGFMRYEGAVPANFQIYQGNGVGVLRGDGW